MNLKYSFSDAEVFYILSPWLKNLFEYLPAADRIIEYNPPENRNILIKFFSAVKLILKLRSYKFDLVFLGHRKNIFGIILFLSGIKYRMGFSRTLFVNIHASFNENVHETFRYNEILKNAGIEIKYNSPVLFRKKDIGVIKGDELIPDCKTILGLYPFGGINPGTRMPIKKWDLERFIELAYKLKNYNENYFIIIFKGLIQEETLPEEIQDSRIIIRTISNDLLSVCNLLVAGDTGSLHIASGFGISTVSLFGPTNPELLAPVSSADVIHSYIWKKPDCSPCYTPVTAFDRKNKKYWLDNEFICHKGTVECIKSITVEEVFNAIKQILNSK